MGVKKLTIDFGNVSLIDTRAFENCSSLKTIDFKNVSQIKGGAFANCTNLESINLRNASIISGKAFKNCNNLKNVTMLRKAIQTNSELFEDCHPDLIIYGYPGSTAEWISKYGGKFVPIDKNEEKVQISIPTFLVIINGMSVDNSNASYPCIVHKDITYFPMTYSGSRSLGLTADWTEENGLMIEKTGTAPYIPEFEQNSVPNSSGETATIATGKITVNGKAINNAEEEYPLLVFRDITYFPLTWRFAVEEFGWEYSFTPEEGLSISCK